MEGFLPDLNSGITFEFPYVLPCTFLQSYQGQFPQLLLCWLRISKTMIYLVSSWKVGKCSSASCPFVSIKRTHLLSAWNPGSLWLHSQKREFAIWGLLSSVLIKVSCISLSYIMLSSTESWVHDLQLRLLGTSQRLGKQLKEVKFKPYPSDIPSFLKDLSWKPHFIFMTPHGWIKLILISHHFCFHMSEVSR